MEERRRSRRVIMPEGHLAALPCVLTVQVLDISVAGVLLQVSRKIEVGARGSLRVNVGGVPFSADLEVKRVSSAPASSPNGSYRIGAMFVAISSEHQQVIERFANQ